MENGSRSYFIAVFLTTHATLKAEETLKKARIPLEVVPKPTKVRSRCGLALRIPTEYLDKVREISSKEELKLVEVVTGVG
ncbi:MAG: DUF3343 domain-containing protein [Candidatus Eisenbacteria bacterium]|nr:DUF3343 domain-containing protein [Candidatus Eisenbacteria bacterium]